MESKIDSYKMRKNINNLMKRATDKQLRLIYLVAYEIVNKD